MLCARCPSQLWLFSLSTQRSVCLFLIYTLSSFPELSVYSFLCEYLCQPFSQLLEAGEGGRISCLTSYLQLITEKALICLLSSTN